MASLRKKANSANWFACFRVPTGRIARNGKAIFRPVHRSTGTRDEARARAMADAFDHAAVMAAERKWTKVLVSQQAAVAELRRRPPLAV